MTVDSLQSVEIKAFVPARDFAQSLRFYERIGCVIAWSSSDLAYLRFGETSFLLQNFYVAEHAGNFMMSWLVDDADAWHRHIVATRVVAEFGVRLGKPADRAWGIRDFTLTDPAGVLWRIGHNLPQETR